ncbi:MAG: glycolate oxidase subunit GlcE [Rhodospirillales bacterium]|jgi:glycolate oxidase FAD binding subunit|nr:glycolate oxidase subunit GlcE [Rhodospirillales bacterium]MBT4041508.1 glycolate oxidase subunit GlcE [Rhodospirillales bacterium]MBT4627513.1 glycolate oxidase subunit GlcE [Rhodospirillales bacterium]MBT5352915.1 glycolate oxidase subunit GlcE [Rhodospirillales bacterium]MBT5520211.1 glycolate oxidase subunit GlcE [Rhodospirillales bacterium]
MTETLHPENEDQLLDALKWAVSARAPLNVIGLGSKATLGQSVQIEQALDLSALSGILHYEPSELVLTARAGTPLNHIQQALAENNQEMAFEPVNLGAVLSNDETAKGSIGGLIAGGFAGPRRIRQGSVRDHMLGFRAISGRGELFKSGGKVMKNVTGFDLSKLMTGSMGTLAIMSEVSIKVLPVPEKSRTVLVYGLSDEDAVAAMRLAVNSPHEVSSAAHLPAAIAARSGVDLVAGAGSGVTAIRVEGPGPSVEARCASLQKSLSPFGTLEELHSQRSTQFWAEVRDAGYWSSTDVSIWRLSVPPSRGADIASTIMQQCGGEALFDWGGGLIWLAVEDGHQDAIRSALSGVDGHATLVRGVEATRQSANVFQPQPAPLAALSTRVKTAFDPYGILNPGRLYPVA